MNLDFSNSWVDPQLSTISISNVLSMLSEPFDSAGVAEKTYNKHYNDEASDYYHMNTAQILDEWSRRAAESKKYGKLSDDYIECILTKTDLDLEMWKLDNNFDYDERLKNNCSSFDEFYKVFSPKYDFVTREVDIFFKVPEINYYIRGRVDAIFKNKQTGRYLVIDWKTSGTIDKKASPWTNNLKGPASKYPALNWYTYTMQVFFYKTGLVESGYLPEGTTFDDIDVAIVDFPGKYLSNGYNWEYNLPAFPYDENFMIQLFSYAVKRTELEKKIADSKPKTDVVETTVVPENEDTVNQTTLF